MAIFVLLTSHWSHLGANTIGMGYHYRSLYEMVLFLEKGKRKLNDLSIPDVLDAPRVRNGYPAEKPVVLPEIFVRQSSSPQEVVLDPFMGSGTTAEVARKHGCACIGIELNAEYIDLAAKRLQQNVLEFGA